MSFFFWSFKFRSVKLYTSILHGPTVIKVYFYLLNYYFILVPFLSGTLSLSPLSLSIPLSPSLSHSLSLPLSQREGARVTERGTVRGEREKVYLKKKKKDESNIGI